MMQPDFDNLLRVLDRKAPARPTLFEFFLNGPLYDRLAGSILPDNPTEMEYFRRPLLAFYHAGYDYATIGGSNFSFPAGEHNRDKTISLNEGAVITDRASFEAYEWRDPDAFSYDHLDTLAGEIPPGMKLIVHGPGGVLENVIGLVGFDNLCMLLADDPELVEEIFAAVGSRLVRYYTISAGYKAVGACISNDDWGFKTQTMLTPAQMRALVFPWHKRIVEVIHQAGKPVILHSCGNQRDVMEDIIEDMQYDGRHSYEDAIEPVEDAYERWGRRIAILGGIDVDFLCRSTPAQIHARAQAMLDRSAARGSYALGSGNSIPEYIPQEAYFAMISAAREEWRATAGGCDIV